MSSPQKPELLIIGIDGADYQIIQHLFSRDQLPALKQLAGRGCLGPIRSTTPALTPPAWSSMMTGQGPGKHGIFGFTRPGSAQMDTPVASRRKAMTVFEALSEEGHRVGTLNLPMTYPPRPLSGFQVSGFDAPEFSPAIARPRRAFEVLQEAVGEYEVFPEALRSAHPDDTALRTHLQMPVQGLSALLDAIPCDICMVSFQVVDWMQHVALPREMDGHDAATLSTDGRVADIYRAVDAQIDKILDRWATPDTTVAIISDHGGTCADRFVNVEQAFVEAGLLSFENSHDRGGGANGIGGMVSAWRKLKGAAPGLGRLLGPLTSRMRGAMDDEYRPPAVDWSQTRAAPVGSHGEIMVNIRGRDPQGIVDPSAIEAVQHDVHQLLMAITDPDTGEPVYSTIAARQDLYEGPWADRGPDMVAIPAHPRYFTAHSHSGMGNLHIENERAMVLKMEPGVGLHAPEGTIIVAGPDVPHGSRIHGAAMEDFVPTLLYLLGQPLPEDLDGTVLADVTGLDALEKDPPRTTHPWPAPYSSSEGYSPDEQQAVEARLRDLGYM